MAEQKDSNTLDLKLNEPLIKLSEFLSKQLQDLHKLTDIADGIKEEQSKSKTVESLKAYEDQISLVTRNQQKRFWEIDRIINKHVLTVKKGKALEEQILILGKEIRKTEAGIRTVKLFLCDAINMLKPELSLVNRINDRIQYVYIRSTELKNEIALLQAKLK